MHLNTHQKKKNPMLLTCQHQLIIMTLTKLHTSGTNGYGHWNKELSVIWRDHYWTISNLCAAFWCFISLFWFASLTKWRHVAPQKAELKAFSPKQTDVASNKTIECIFLRGKEAEGHSYEFEPAGRKILNAWVYFLFFLNRQQCMWQSQTKFFCWVLR